MGTRTELGDEKRLTNELESSIWGVLVAASEWTDIEDVRVPLSNPR